MYTDFTEFLEEVNDIAMRLHEQDESELLVRLEQTVRCLCVNEGVDITLEDYDTG